MNVNICRPGYNASCALCCGSHNYNALPGEIDSLFRKRREIFLNYSREYLLKRMNASRSDMTGSYYFADRHGSDIIITLPKLYDDGLQCPFVSSMEDPREIGCALYPNTGEEDLRFECFQNYTCKYFSCQSRELLTDREVLFAARLLGDWYYYTMMIHSINILRDVIIEYTSPEMVSPRALTDIRNRLVTFHHKDVNLYPRSSYFS